MLLGVVLGVGVAWAGPTIPRWGVTLDLPDDEGWVVVDRGDTVLLDDAAGTVARVVLLPNSGCGAAVSPAPEGVALDPRWRFAGTGGEGSVWCATITGGTLRLGFGRSPVPTVAVEALSALLDAPITATARPPVAPRKDHYSLVTYLTLRRYMPGRPTDVVNGRGVMRLDGAWQGQDRTDYGGAVGLGWEVHAFRGLAVGWEARTAIVPGRQDRSAAIAEGRFLLGGGLWFGPYVGAAAYSGVGFDVLTVFDTPALTVPAELVVFAGAHRFGGELVGRADLAVVGARQALDIRGPFDGTYARAALWFLEKTPERYDYTDYGRRGVWAGLYVSEQFDRTWAGATLGYGYVATPKR